VTCLGLDILRTREHRIAHAPKHTPAQMVGEQNKRNGHALVTPEQEIMENASLSEPSPQASPPANGHRALPDGQKVDLALTGTPSVRQRLKRVWTQFDYWLGVATTLLVALAWVISLASKPLATGFGGTVAIIGMILAYLNYARGQGRVPVVTTYLPEHLPNALLAVLVAHDEQNDSVINAAISHAQKKPVVFLYLAEPGTRPAPKLFEVVDPYLEDQSAKSILKQAALLANEAKLTTRFVYKQQTPEMIANIWQKVRPHAMVLAADRTTQCEQLSPDYIRYELTPQGKVAHVLKSW
jgi:hypothetical protein